MASIGSRLIVFLLTGNDEPQILLYAISSIWPMGADAGQALVPLVLIVMNIACAASAYPSGLWSDGIGRRKVLLAGVGLLVASDIVFALASHMVAVFAGVVLWDLHMGFTQGLLAAMVTDVVPERMRGTALGPFNLVSGIVVLAASVLAGELWDQFGPAGTFGTGAVLSGLALCGLVLYGAKGTVDERASDHSQD